MTRAHVQEHAGRWLKHLPHAENTTSLCEKVRGGETDRQTEMTSCHGFFLHVQWDVVYSCRAASVGCTVAESAPWWITGPNSRQFLCLNTSEHPEKLAKQSMDVAAGGCHVEEVKGLKEQRLKHLFHQAREKRSRYLWWWRLTLNQIQQIANKDAAFVPHLHYIRKQC